MARDSYFWTVATVIIPQFEVGWKRRGSTAAEQPLNIAGFNDDQPATIQEVNEALPIDLMVEKGLFTPAKAEFGELLATDPGWERRTYAQHWLVQVNQYEAHAAQLRVCGRDAVVKVLELFGKSDSVQKARLESAQSDKGFSLAELLDFARKYGLDGTAVRATADLFTTLPFPFIAHYSDDHYVAVPAPIGNDKVRLYDPRLQRETVISRDSFFDQWSHVAVIFGRPPAGVELVSNTEAQNVVGGCCGIPRYPSGLGGGGPPGCGMPTWSVNPVNMNLVVSDTPLWYSNQFGPSVAITITYNSQDSLNQVRPFGNKWVFNFASYAMESPGGAPQGSVLIVMPDGRGDIYQPNGNGGYISPSGVASTLVKTGDYAFQLTHPDGFVYAYGVPPSMNGSGFASLLLSITDRYGSALTIQHDSAGNITQIVDPLGRATQLSYDQAGLVQMVQDPFGRKATFSYDAHGDLTGQSDMGGVEYGYSYDPSVYLTAIIKPTGTTTFYVEPADGNYVSSNFYPAYGASMSVNYRITVTDPEGNKEEYYYSQGGFGWHRDKIQMKASLAVVQAPMTTFFFAMASGQGAVREITYEDGSTIQCSNFDSNRLPQNVVKENGSSETLSYNQFGMPLSYTNSRQNKFQWTYAQNGIDVIKRTDPLSEVITSSYDSSRNLTAIQNALNQTTSLTYNNRGQIATITRPGGEETDFAYDNLGQLTTVSRAGQVLTSFTYDPIGRVTTAADAVGDFVAYQYDDLNRVTAIKYPDGTSQRWNWACCRVDSYIARDGSTSEYYYDGLGRMVGFRNPNRKETWFTYDENGNLTRLIDGNFNVTQYVYGPRNWLLKKIFSDGTSLGYQYDASGHVSAIVDSAGERTSLTYDQDENLTTETFPDLPTVAFGYDSLDRVSTMNDSSGTTKYKYDAAGRLVSISNSQNNAVVAFNWDSNGRLIERDINGVPQKYVYDAIGRVTSLTNALGTFGYGYPNNASPLVASMVFPNGIQSSSAYDGSTGDVRLKSIGYTDGSGNNVLNFGFTYTTNAQVQSLASQVGSNPSTTTTYGYDLAGQLASAITQVTATGQNVRSYSFVYDSVGNRIGQASDATVASYQYNGLNQLVAQTGRGVIPFRGTVSKPASIAVNGQSAWMTGNITFETDLSVQTGPNPIHVEAVDGNGVKTINDYTLTVTGVGNKNYQYDTSGNLVSDGDNTYTWDSQNRLTGIQSVQTGGTQLQFFYDGLGRNFRIVQMSGGSVVADRRFVWVGLERCEERDASGNVVKRFFPQGESWEACRDIFSRITSDRFERSPKPTDQSRCSMTTRLGVSNQ